VGGAVLGKRGGGFSLKKGSRTTNDEEVYPFRGKSRKFLKGGKKKSSHREEGKRKPSESSGGTHKKEKARAKKKEG